MVDLPPEIWTIIGRYLPRETVIHLMSVNRLFYTLSMNEKYKELEVVQVDGNLSRRLKVLRNPEHAKRVRSLCLEPDTLHALAHYEAVDKPRLLPARRERNALGTLAIQMAQTIPPSPFPPDEATVSPLDMIKDLETVIPLLHNVVKFSFSWDMVSKLNVPYLSLAWQTLGPNLQHLDLYLHPWSLASQLPQDVDFPCLSSLHCTLDLTIADDPPDHQAKVGEAMANFINKFKTTLQTLYIGSQQRGDLSRMYGCLTRFDKLQSFEINPHTVSSPTSLITFLKNHSHTLSTLTYVSDANPLFKDGLSKLELHILQKLVMRLNHVPHPKDWWSVPSPFFNSVSTTLRVLSIEGAVTIQELDQLLGALVVANPQGVALRELSFSVSSLSVDVFARIARKVPKLNALDLRIHDVVAKGGFPMTPSDFFPSTSTTKPPYPHQTTPTDFIQSAEEVLSLLDWHLQDITIKRSSCCGDLMLWGLMKLCAECIPTIRSLAGRGTLEIPHPPNPKPKGKNARCYAGFPCSFRG